MVIFLCTGPSFGDLFVCALSLLFSNWRCIVLMKMVNAEIDDTPSVHWQYSMSVWCHRINLAKLYSGQIKFQITTFSNRQFSVCTLYTLYLCRINTFICILFANIPSINLVAVWGGWHISHSKCEFENIVPVCVRMQTRHANTQTTGRDEIERFVCQ